MDSTDHQRKCKRLNITNRKWDQLNNDIQPGEPVIIFDYTVVLRFDGRVVERQLTLRKREREGRLLDPEGEKLATEAIKRACKKANLNVADVRGTVRWTRSRLTTAR